MLDTNVLSELIRLQPDGRVVAWLKAQTRSALFTTAVTRSEMLFGVLMLPEGRRKARMHQQVQAIFASDMHGRVLAYDSAAADAHAEIAAARRAQGRPISQTDAMIAGIARSRGASLATRNLRDFEGSGLDLLDPWR